MIQYTREKVCSFGTQPFFFKQGIIDIFMYVYYGHSPELSRCQFFHDICSCVHLNVKTDFIIMGMIIFNSK